jgi:3-phenylpropionate/cinnamic acid dioxygenase small subunit
MMQEKKLASLLELADRVAIQDAIYRYARAVDRSDWEGVRDAYHHDAYDDHGEYKGNVNGLVEWLTARFESAENGMHLVANCLVEFIAPNLALVETYFVSHRLRPAAGAAEVVNTGPDGSTCRQGWGRYVDEFQRRDDGIWRVAHRTVVMDSVITVAVPTASRTGPAEWGVRGHSDIFYRRRAALRQRG